MFDLERAIAAWRRGLSARGIVARETLDELEAHLRDGIKHRLQTGLAPSQAFDLAVGRLGPPGTLSTEFAKVGTDVAMRPRTGVLIGLAALAVAAVGFLGLTLTNVTSVSTSNPSNWQHVAPGLFLLLLLSIPAALAWIGYHFGVWRGAINIATAHRPRLDRALCMLIGVAVLSGLIVWAIGVHAYAGPLITALLMLVLAGAGGALVGLRTQTQRSRHAATIVTLGGAALLISAAWTMWPLRVTFLFARSELEAMATRFESGEPIELPRWIGAFHITRIERSWRGSVCFWSSLGPPGGDTGFVRCTPAELAFNCARCVQLDGRWHFISED